MSWSKLAFSPGIVKDVTRYASDGTWVDGSLVRFINGKPERWAGWVRYLEALTMDGKCRSIGRWSALSGYVWTGLGTSHRFYVASDDLYYDVSPIGEVVVLNNPFATTVGSPLVVVTHASHGHLVGDILLISGASAVGGLTLNGEYTVTSYIDENSYRITASSNASSTATGGGAAVTISYIRSAGGDNQSTGGGWGSGAWGADQEWGSASPTADNLGVWTQSNWGEDLVACIMDGPIYYWDATNPSGRMVDILDLPLADGLAPQSARFIAVSHRDRHLLAFGPSHEFGGTDPAPMTVRWCSQEDIYNWNEADETGTAGSIPLSRGSKFVAICATQTELLAWSDAAMYSLQFVGAPDVYVSNIISNSAEIAGSLACVASNTTVYWMGRSGFYLYDGRVQTIPSTVWQYVESNMNWTQAGKIFASLNKSYDEIIWYYPSINSMENDSYVSFNTASGDWTIGLLGRTAWLDASFQYPPLGAGADNKLYFHETGNDDGSQIPPGPINAYIESAPFELSSEGAYSKGDRFAFMRRILPDVTFLDPDGVNTPSMNMVIKTMDKPGGGFKSASSSQVQQTAIIPVEEFTDDCHVRLRGRSVTIRYESSTLGTRWRIGQPRFDIRSDGQR